LNYSVYRMAVAIVLAFTVYHGISLPVAISYDGLQYIDLADVLFSSRFPAEWLNIRTPLYPLSLKFSFALFGHTPFALKLVSTGIGCAGLLALGFVVRRFLGEWPAAAALLIGAFYPTLIGFQHYAITEVGSFAFLAFTMALLAWHGTTPRFHLLRAAALLVVLVAGYYWRQNVLVVAVPVALLHGWAAMTEGELWPTFPKADKAWLRRSAPVALQVMVIAIMPYVFAKPWDRYIESNGMRDYMLQQGMVRQGLLPVDHPQVGAYKERYRAALAASVYQNNFYSGMREDLVGEVCTRVFANGLAVSGPQFFWTLVKQNPGRYASGIGRTLMQFAGFPALEKESHYCRDNILSLSAESKISDGEPGLTARIRKEFVQKPADSIVHVLLRRLVPVYDNLLIVANFLTAIGLILGLILQNYKLSVLCGIPVAFIAPLAIIVSCPDRYVFPVYPITLFNLVAVPLILFTELTGRRNLSGASGMASEKDLSSV